MKGEKNDFLLEKGSQKNFQAHNQFKQCIKSESFSLNYNNCQNLFKKDEFIIYIDGYAFFKNDKLFSKEEHFHFISNLEYLYEDNNLSGDFNIIIINQESNIIIVITSHLGMKPIYIGEINRNVIITNRINNVFKLKNNNLDYNYATLLEHLLYNYPISNNTFIDRFQLIPPAVKLVISNTNNIIQKSYWKLDDELFSSKFPVQGKRAIQLIDDSLDNAIQKYIKINPYIALSLTGGWDGRLLLSYLLKNNFQNFFLYSFGTPSSPDTEIPKKIAQSLDIDYESYYLNENYYNNHFLDDSINNILHTDGIRPFLRTHYYYALKNVGNKSNFVFSGNCASNIVKFANRKPGDVYNQNLFDLLFDSNKEDTILKQISEVETLLDIQFNKNIKGKAINQIIQSDIYLQGATKNQLFYKVLLQNIERKYYGYEMLGYYDFVHNISPFIDIDFIKALSQTIYFGANHDFEDKTLKSRRMTSLLYAKLIKKNSHILGSFITDRGFSTNDMLTPNGLFKVCKKKFIKKNNQKLKDYYGMNDAFKIIFDYLEKNKVNKGPFGAEIDSLKKHSIINNRNKNLIGNYLSYLIWNKHVERKL